MILNQKGSVRLRAFFNNFKDLFASKNDVILVDDDVQNTDKIDIVLSPRFYWVKKQTLPLKYEYQAKSYAKSVFEGCIPSGNYTYLAKKHNDEFLLFAYDDAFIVSELEKMGINFSKVQNVYFSQIEFLNIDEAIKINDNFSLAKHDDIIIKMPNQMLKSSILFQEVLRRYELPKYSINLNKFNKIIDSKKTIFISILLVFLIFLYGIEFFLLQNEYKNLEQKQESLQVKYKLPRTSLQTNAIIDRLNKQKNEQTNLREKLSYLLKLPLAKNDFASEISISLNKITCIISLKNQDQKDKYTAYLQKHFKILQKSEKKNMIIYELSYD